MIALDAGVLIGYLETSDPFHRPCVEFLLREAASAFVANALTVAESIVWATRAGDADEALEALERAEVAVTTLDPDQIRGLAETRAATGLRMPDALVLHTAESSGAAIATTDRRLARAAEERGVRVHLIPPD